MNKIPYSAPRWYIGLPSGRECWRSGGSSLRLGCGRANTQPIHGVTQLLAQGDIYPNCPNSKVAVRTSPAESVFWRTSFNRRSCWMSDRSRHQSHACNGRL